MSAALTTAVTVLAEGGSDDGGFTPTSVTPGLTGFIVVFLVGLVTVLLILDMTRRVRRMQARERVAAAHREESAPDRGETARRAEDDALGDPTGDTPDNGRGGPSREG